MSGPYANTAHAYRRAGWAPLPLPVRAKAPVPEGWTGRAGAWPSGADVQAWCEMAGDGNVALRMPPTVLGIDVDAYESKQGAATLEALEADLGALPPTWRSTSRDDGTSGIRFYLVPAGRRWPGILGPGIEVVRHEHRYAVAWPSVHPDTGLTYRWLTPEGTTSVAIPNATDLPTLPQPWLERFGSEALTDMPSADLGSAAANAWLAEHGGGDPCEIMRRALETALADLQRGSRHEAALLGANRLVWLAAEGHPGANSGLYVLRLQFTRAVQGDRSETEATGEWGRLLVGAVNLAAASHAEIGGDPCKFADLVPAGSVEPAAPISGEPTSGSWQPASERPSGALPLRAVESPQSPSPSPTTQEPPARLLDPLEAAWRASLVERFPRLDWHALWADTSTEEWLHEPLVGRGRSVVIYSPPKIGKSLLALELAVAMARGVPWLGHTPVRPLRVLYLDFENSPRDDLRVRLQAMEIEPGDLDNLVLLSFPPMSGLDTARGAQELLSLAEFHQPDLIVADTISRVIAGEENSNDTWLQIYRNVGLPLKALGIAVLRLDHTGKDEDRGMRGGSAKYGDVDAVWRLSQIVPGERYRLECTQSRMALPVKVLDIERRTGPLGHWQVGALDVTSHEAVVLRLIALAEDAGLPLDANREAIRALAARYGLSRRNETLAEVVRRRKALLEAPHVGMGHPLYGKTVVPIAVPRALTPDLSPEAGDSLTSGAHFRRSALSPDPSGQVGTPGLGVSVPVSPTPEAGERDTWAKSGGWSGWRNVAGQRVWVAPDGSVHDGPPQG